MHLSAKHCAKFCNMYRLTTTSVEKPPTVFCQSSTDVIRPVYKLPQCHMKIKCDIFFFRVVVLPQAQDML